MGQASPQGPGPVCARVTGSNGRWLSDPEEGAAAFPGVPLARAGASRACGGGRGPGRGQHGPLTFGAQVQSFQVEGTAPQGDLLKNDAEAVDVAGLGAARRRRGHAQELGGCPQLFCGSEVSGHRAKGPEAKRNQGCG